MPWFVAGGQPQWVNDPTSMLGASMGQGVSGAMGNPYAPSQEQQIQQAMDYAEEQRRQWDADHAQKQQQLDQQYEIAKMSARSSEEAREIDRWYREQSIALERERLSQDDRQFGQTLAQRQYEFGENMGLSRARLGYDVMSRLADLGAANPFQAAELARGFSQMPESSTFVTALMNNARMPGFGAQGGLPTPESYGTMMTKLRGDPTGGVAGPNIDSTLAGIGNIAAKGAHQLGGGALEQLSPSESNIFSSGLKELGIDVPSFLSQYQRSRIGNRLSSAAMA